MKINLLFIGAILMPLIFCDIDNEYKCNVSGVAEHILGKWNMKISNSSRSSFGTGTFKSDLTFSTNPLDLSIGGNDANGHSNVIKSYYSTNTSEIEIGVIGNQSGSSIDLNYSFLILKNECDI